MNVTELRVALTVADFDEAVAFYRNAVGRQKIGKWHRCAAIEIGFNPVFLLDALKVCGDTVTIEMKEPTKPGVLKSGPDFLYVVMPVSLS